MSDDAVLTALEEQVVCYRRLAKLAGIQHDYVQQSQVESLLAVLGMRQEVLDQITGLEQSIGPAKGKWQEYLDALDSASRIRAESLLAETRALLEEITSADRNDALVLQQRKLDLGKAINKASAARQVNRNYANAAYGRRPSTVDVQR